VVARKKREMTTVHRRPALPREFLEASRRRRFACAVAEIVHESGVHAVTVTRICRTARSARNTFYDHFENVNDCLRYAVGEGFDHLFAPVREVGEQDDDWLLGVERAITGFYAAAAADPLLAELLLIHSFAVQMDDDDRDFDAGVAAMVTLLARGRGKSPAKGEPVPLTEDYLARVIISLAVMKLRQGEGETLPSHGREMTVLVGNAYLGIEQTARILGAANAGAQAPSPK
jgi:AcrR family transcriptional regulator